MRQLPPNNDWTLGLPVPTSAPVPLLATVEDTGKFVKGILLNREKVLGKRIYGATAYYSVAEIAKEFQEVFPQAGKTAKAVELPNEVFKSGLGKSGMPEEGQEELLQNMRLMHEFGYYGGAKLDESHSVSSFPNGFTTTRLIISQILVDKLTTWKEYMAKAKPFADLK